MINIDRLLRVPEFRRYDADEDLAYLGLRQEFPQKWNKTLTWQFCSGCFMALLFWKVSSHKILLGGNGYFLSRALVRLMVEEDHWNYCRKKLRTCGAREPEDVCMGECIQLLTKRWEPTPSKPITMKLPYMSDPLKCQTATGIGGKKKPSIAVTMHGYKTIEAIFRAYKLIHNER